MSSILSHQLAELEKLTQAREQAALARLSDIAARKRAAELQVAELFDTNHEATTAIEAKLISNWQTWQKNELAKRNMKLAALEAEYRQTAMECGRYVAEQAVVSELVGNARKDEATLRQRRQAFTFPGGQCP